MVNTPMPMRQPRLFTAPPTVGQRDAAADARRELAAGLLAQPATASPKFFYDALGCALFVAITQLDEYAATRTERAILQAHGADIVARLRQRLGAGCTLVDLGAGDGAKAAQLFGPLGPSRYVAVDIAVDFMAQALAGWQQRFPAIDVVGVGQDFAQQLQLPAGLVTQPALLFYPGSSIGNFGPDDALRLLVQGRAAVQGGALLIGVDLVKPVALMEAAYDDALGVTAAFNLNLLRHANRLLGSDFDPRQWRHAARFNVAASRIEMHLHARQALTVRWPGGERAFAAGESIHTENAHKWTPASFEALLRDAGWRPQQHWLDDGAGFGVFLAHG